MTLDELLEALDRWHDELAGHVFRVGEMYTAEPTTPGVTTEIETSILDSAAHCMNLAATALEQMRLDQIDLRAQIRTLHEVVNAREARHG